MSVVLYGCRQGVGVFCVVVSVMLFERRQGVRVFCAVVSVVRVFSSNMGKILFSKFEAAEC